MSQPLNASQPVIAHTVKAGERWDLLAYRYYGDIGELNRLIDANPHLALAEQLPTGATLFVPIIEQATTNQSDLPPWLQ